MRDSRAGECLWYEWTGHGYEQTKSHSVLFFTHDHVDVEHEVVRRALASALQRDGTATSLGDGYRAIDSSATVHGYAGIVDGDHDLTVCDQTGETFHGDQVDNSLPVTWVEVE